MAGALNHRYTLRTPDALVGVSSAKASQPCDSVDSEQTKRGTKAAGAGVDLHG